MNKKSFRVIFSKTLQRLVAVSELAKTTGKTNESGTTSGNFLQKICKIRPLTFYLFCAWGVVGISQNALAELMIQADKSAQKNEQPIVLKTPNGLPQVNIQTPNDKGLSHNKYSKFDVDTKGAILNNSRTQTQTQLAGTIQANPYLARGEAKVILNEVNSNDPSILKGYIEVAGKKADVIIANPSGLHCEGCGIINASGATLTTAKPQIENGSLESFIVEKGRVKVSGTGLDNSRVDYTDIIAKEAEINAGVWSKKKLTAITGKNTVKARSTSNKESDLQIINTATTKTLEEHDIPKYALDVSALGGMYAGKVHLIGTEQGLGVRNTGHIGASSDNVKIDSQGRIVNKGIINGNDHLELNAKQGIENQGRIETKYGNIVLNSRADIKQDGSIVTRQGNIRQRAEQGIRQTGETVAGGNISFNADDVAAAESSLIAAGINIQNTKQGETRQLSPQADNGKEIHIITRQQAVLNGKNIASGVLQIKASKANLDKSQTSANRININVKQGDIQANQANISAKDTLRLSTPKILSTANSHLSAKHIQTAQTDLNTRNAVWEQTGEQDFTLKAKTINNQGGVIKTQGRFKIETEQVNNNKGILFSERRLNITVDKINNQQGIIESTEDMRLSATRLDNQAGVVRSKNAKLDIAEINNNAVSDKGSLILVTDSLVLNSKQLNNQATKAKDIKPVQGILANTMTLDVDNLDNRQGGVYSGKIVTVIGKTRLDNHQGELLTLESLDIKDKSGKLVVNNREGLLQAGKRIMLQAKNLASEGSIKTAGDLFISLKDSFILNKAFEVGNNFNFKTEGNFENNTKLIVNNQATISAQTIQNNKNAEVSSKETTLVSKNLINRGLIDGHNTLIKSDEVTNIGTGRIYADYLAFKSNIIKNLSEKADGEIKSGTIVARNRLDLGVNKFINSDKSLLLSLGEAYIGNDLDKNNQAIGKAALIENNSATIEFLGNARVSTKKFINRDTHVKTRIREEKEEFDLYGKEDPITKKVERWYRVGVDGLIDHANGQRHKSATFDFYDPNKQDIVAQKGELWQRKKFTQIKEIAESYDESPAEFLVGGNLALNSQHVLNQYSKLLIGDKLYFNEQEIDHSKETIQTENGILENKDLTATLTERKSGDFYRYQQDRRRSGKRRHHKNFFDEKVRHPLDEYTSNTSRLTLALNTIGTKLSPIPHSDIAAQSPADNIRLNTMPKIALGEDKSNQTNPPASIKTHLADITLPNASLYTINPKAKQGYIVETDPRFINRTGQLSSNYLFERLGNNGEHLLKRLGDGFYEQRLVNEQIYQLTGRRYLDGYENDIEQYKALMANGAKYAKKFNLKVGIGLTAAQMSKLTTDMVWLVNKDITLADGHRVSALVPQVYLLAKDSDITAHGTVISAKEIRGNTASLHNNGVIAGRDLTYFNTESLKNSGTILGNRIDLSAKQSLVNLAGKIETVDFLRLSANKKLEITGTLSDTKSKYGNIERTSLDKTATVSVTGENGRLILQSDGDITLKAADITSKGTIAAEAKELNITTANIKNKEHYNGNADNYYRLDQKSEIGSRLKGNNGVTLIAENEAILRQAEITSPNGNVTVAAKQGDIKVEAGRTEERLAGAVKSTRRGILNKITEKQRYVHNINEAVGSNLDGKNVSLIAEQGNISIKGSAAVAENDLTIVAKQDISILADKNTYFRDEKTERKKSGLMGTGGIGFTIGSKKERIEQDNTQERAVRSQVGSLKGNVTIQAGEHYQQTGSVVTSGKGDIDISAQSAEITAAHSDYESHYKYSTEQKGVTVALTGSVASALQAVDSTLKSAKALGSSKNDRINALGAVNAGFEAKRAAEQVQGIAKAASEGSATGGAVGVSVTYGQQKSEQTQHSKGNMVEKSQVNAGGKVNILTMGKGEQSQITISGADVSGQMGTHLKSDGKVNIEAIDENHLERSKNKSSGFSAGVGIQFGDGITAGVTADGNVAKGYGNGESQAWVASQVGSENSRTTIESSKDTNIIGSQVKGKRVEVRAENLNIESVQDTAKYKGKQESISGQVTVGYGTSVGGSYNQSKINSDYASVKTQAGILADDEGYDVNVNNKVHLTGGAILSSAEKDKNSLSARTFSFTDIENHSAATASAAGFGAGFSVGRDQTSEEDKQKNKVYRTEREENGEAFDKANPNKGSSNSIKFGLGESDVHSADFYALAKIGTVNLLSNTKKSINSSSVTSSVISDGVFTIQDREGQENISHIKKGTTEQTNRLEQQDYRSLQKDVETDTAIKKGFYTNMAGLTDEAYRAMFIAEHRMFTAETDENGVPRKDEQLEKALDDEAREVADNKLSKGEITQGKYEREVDIYKANELGKGRNMYKLREISDQERNNLKQVTYTDLVTGKSETRYVIAFNGIFNDENAAAKFAWQNYVAKEGESGKIDNRIHQDVYFVHHPTANNSVSELLVAGYEKMFETSFGNLLGMDNSSLQAKDLMTKYGKDNLFIGSHSRGTLTVANALNALNTEENRNNTVLSDTKVKMVGPAANVTNADNVLSRLQTGKARANGKGSIRIENHEQDPVGSMPIILGGNPATMNDNEQNRGLIRRIIDMFGDNSSMHNCYGLGQEQCKRDGYRKEGDLMMNKEQTIYDLNKNRNKQ